MLRRMVQALATSTARSAAAVSGGGTCSASNYMQRHWAVAMLQRSARARPPLSVVWSPLLAGRRRPPCHQRSCRAPALAVCPPGARGGWWCPRRRRRRRRRRPRAARRGGSLAAPRRLRGSRGSRRGDLPVPGRGEAVVKLVHHGLGGLAGERWPTHAGSFCRCGQMWGRRRRPAAPRRPARMPCI